MKKKEIIKEIKKGIVLDDTYKKDKETFYLICDFITINNMSIQNVQKIEFIKNIMYIDDNKINIDTDDIDTIQIYFTSLAHKKENIKIIISD